MNKKFIFFLLIAFLLLQAFFISCYIPFNEWFSPSIIYTDDFPLHYGDMLDKKFFMNTYCSTWGYNPYQRAGTVANVIVGIDNNAWALWAFSLPFFSGAVAFKLYFIFLIFVIPLLLYGTARNFELGDGESFVCVVLGTLFVHTTICVDFIYWGTVSYISSVYLSLYIASLTYRFLKTREWPVLVLQTLLLGAALWIHIFTVLNCLPFIMVLYCAVVRRLPWRRLVLSMASLLTAAALTCPWLIPFIRMLDSSHINPVMTFYTTTDFFEWVNTYFFGKLLFNTYVVPFQKSVLIDRGLMLFGIWGLLLWKKEGAGVKAAACGYTIAFLFLLAYYGSFVNFTRSLTPLRFIIIMNLFLILPASSALCCLYKRLTNHRPVRVRLALVACFMLMLALLAARPYYHLFVKKEFQLRTQLPQELEQLITYIKNSTTDEARILIENSDWESGHQYGGGHFPYILPHLTGRQFIGNDFAYNPTKDSMISFFCGQLFQRPIETLRLEDVSPLCDLYNMSWVICWSQQAKTFFNRYPEYFLPDGTIERFFLYRIKRQPSFFIKGSGIARAEMNKIELKDLAPHQGEIIISYHWMKFLKTDPPLEVERVFYMDDPVGFIKLKNPPRNVLIYNNYK
ncbi:MAG: hypothetical protein JW832_13955 [Deltaproteobacteria bacterium]|nr:hypothetical protein [Deltaproteobacteria bacterium]